MELLTVIRQCEDHLFSAKGMTVRERALYYHLLRHTHGEGKPASLFALLPLAQALGVAESSVREDIRALNERGCLRIEDRSRQGHLVRVLLPEEIEGVVPLTQPEAPIDLEAIDFFNGRRFVSALLARENGRCFYCLKSLKPEVCELDHVISQIHGANHSYRNVVASCHECNTSKLEAPPDAFLRSLFRKGRLSGEELEERLRELEQLQTGERKPSVEMVGAAI